VSEVAVVVVVCPREWVVAVVVWLVLWAAGGPGALRPAAGVRKRIFVRGWGVARREAG